MILNPDRAPALTYAAGVAIVAAALLLYPVLRVWDWYGRYAFARRSRHRHAPLDGVTVDWTFRPVSIEIKQYARRNGLTDAQAAQEWRER